jgi:hypothetical protein
VSRSSIVTRGFAIGFSSRLLVITFIASFTIFLRNSYSLSLCILLYSAIVSGFMKFSRDYNMQIKLAEALLRRKELQQKVDILKNIKQNTLLYEVRGQRVKITDGLDEITATFPKLELSQVTAEYDWHARQLRLIDAAIQYTNWNAEVLIDPMVLEDYKAK